MSEFKYVVQTELKLSPGSLNTLLSEVALLDKQIQSKNIAVPVGLRLNGAGIQQIQKEIGNIKATALVQVRLDNASFSQVKRQIESIVDQVNLSVRPTQTANSNPPMRQAGTNVMSGTGASTSRNNSIRMSERIAMNENREAQARLRNARAMEIELRAQSKLAEAKAREEAAAKIGSTSKLPEYHPVSILNAQRKLSEAEERRYQDWLRNNQSRSIPTGSVLREIQDAQLNYRGRVSVTPGMREKAAVVAQRQADQEELRRYQEWLRNNQNRSRSVGTLADEVLRNQAQYGDLSAPSRGRQEKDRVSNLRRAGERLAAEAQIPENRLLDPSISIKEKTATIERLKEAYRSLAVETGQNIPKSFKMAVTGMDGVTRTITTGHYEFTKFGEVLDRGAKGFAQFSREAIKNSLVYGGIYSGIALITTAFTAGIQAMTNYEAQFIRISHLVNANNNGGLTSGQAQKDIMGLSSKLNLRTNDEVVPVYEEILRRKDILFKDDKGNVKRDEIKDFTELMFRSAYVAEGPGFNGQDAMKISQDAISVYQQMFNIWGGADHAMENMKDYVDFLSMLSERGVDLDKNFDAMKDLGAYAAGYKLDPKLLASMTGAYSNIIPDESGSEISSVYKVFLKNLFSSSDKAKSARNLLGVDVVDPRSNALEVFQTIADNYKSGKYTDQQINLAATNLASVGAIGGTRTPQMANAIKSMSQAMDMMGNDYRGKTEQISTEQIDSLKREFVGLNDQLQRLAIKLGESGILSGIKLVISAFSGLIYIVDKAVTGINWLGGVFDSIHLGPLYKMTIGVLALNGALKGTTALLKALGAQSILGFLGKTLLPGVAGGAAGGAAAGGIKGLLQRSGEMVSGVLLGSMVGGRGARGAGPLADPRRGGMANSAGGLLTSLMGLKNLISGGLTKAILSFIGKIARLSLPIAIIGGAASLVSTIVSESKKEDERNKKGMNLMIDSFAKSDPSSPSQTDGDRLNGFVETWQGMTVAKNKSPNLKFADSDMQRYKEAYDALTANGMKLDATTGEITYTDPNDRKKSGFIVPGDDASRKRWYDTYTAKAAPFKEQAAISKADVDLTLDYNKILERTTELVERLSNAANSVSMASSINSFNFMGVNSSSSILNNMDVYERAISEAQSVYGEFQNNYSTILGGISNAQNNVDRAKQSLVGQGTAGSDAADEVYQNFKSMKAGGGDLEELRTNYSNYKEDDKLGPQKKQYAEALLQQAAYQDALDKGKDESEKAISSMVELASKLKELGSNYLVASTGIAQFEGHLKRLSSTVSAAQHSFTMASTDSDKMSASIDVIASLYSQSAAYRQELENVQSMMDALVNKYGSGQFTMDKLYNPETEVTSEQSAYKELLEKTYEINDQINQATEGMKSQSDTMIELVLNSDKYKDAWDAVKGKMDEAKSIQKQIRDLQNDSKVNNLLSGVQSSIHGTATRAQEAAKYSQQQVENYLSALETASKAVTTFGDDAKTLEEAIGELKATLPKIMQSSVIEPLGDLVNKDMSEIVDKEQQSYGILQSAADQFKSATDLLLSRLPEILNTVPDSATSTDGLVDEKLDIKNRDLANRRLQNKSIKEQTSVTEDSLNTFIAENAPKNSPFIGNASAFIKAGQASGLDPLYLVAHAAEESTWGTSNIAKDKNNYYGIGAFDSDPYKGAHKFGGTMEDGILAEAKWIAKNYADQGQDTLYTMRFNNGSHEYASNPDWAKNIADIMGKYDGSVSPAALKKSDNTAANQDTSSISSMLTEAQKLSASGTFQYKQVAGDFKGTYTEFIQKALSDCSQFVQEMYSEFLGVKLPRTAAEQWKAGKSVSKDDMQAGDLVFFNTTGKEHSHVGIYEGDNKFMQMGNKGLKEGDLTSKYWSDKFEGARRIDGAGTGGALDLSSILEEEQRAQDAYKQNLLNVQKSTYNVYASQIKNLLAQKGAISSDFNNQISDFMSKMKINGQGNADLTSFKFDTIRSTGASYLGAAKQTQDFKDSLQPTLQQYFKDSKDQTKTQEERDTAKSMYTALKEVLKSGTFEKTLDELIKQLRANATALEKKAYYDPVYNATQAREDINKQLNYIQRLRDQGQSGSVDYYKALQDANAMKDNYLTREKQTQIQQQYFDNFGGGYSNLAKSKQIGFGENVALIGKQIQAVSDVLRTLREGTNAWHLVLEDAVVLQEKIVALEDKKTETARRFFELSGGGLKAYINARGYTQGRDTTNAYRGFVNATNNYQGNPSSNYSENLVNLQIVSEMYSSIQKQVSEYRDGVTGAFRAGVLSITEYIKKLNELRNVQEETKNQALELKSSVEQTFQNSLSSALKDAFTGGFDSQQSFMSSIKDGLSSAITGQLSTIMLTQSGLMDTVNNLITSMVNGLASGDPNAAVNFFNNTDFQKQINDAINPFLPFIQQIAESTKGMFTIMKDELYNAPSGFKVDEYLYQMQKPLTYQDVMGEINRNVNEAGAPSTAPTTSTGSTITLPSTTTPIGTGYQDIITNPVQPIDPIGITNPFITETVRNPVRELLNSIASAKQGYDTTSSLGTPGNNSLNSAANNARALLTEIAPNIASAIGDGLSGMSIDELTQYMQSVDLSSYDMVTGIDGVSSTLGTLNSNTVSKLDGVIGAVNNVVAAVAAARSSSSPSSSSSSSAPTTYTSTSSVVNAGSGTSSGTPLAPEIIAKMNAEKAAVISTPVMEQYQEAMKGMYWDGTKWVRKYHTGGIAGLMNFMNPSSLRSNEVNAILQNEETVFQKGQLGSLFHNLFSTGGGSSSGSSTLRIEVDISGNASGVADEVISQAITDGVSQGIAQLAKDQRRNNLLSNGVSYNTKQYIYR